MEAVSDVPGVQRVRFTSPHPKDFPEDLLRLIAARSNLCPQIHLPLQAGNSEVLKRMNREYNREEFLERAHQVRKIIPGVAITTDIIIGFPGESAEQFEDTVSVMEEIRFDAAFIFKYSPREGTIASKKYPDDVSEDEKTRRIIKLNEIQKKHTSESLEKMLGLECQVLIERETTHLSDEQCQGRNEQGVTVVVPQNGLIRSGDFIRVHVTNKTSHVLLAEVIS